MKTKVICTTILVENSPQALPLGAACIASDIKHNPKTKDICDVELISFLPEDEESTIIKKLSESPSSLKSPVIICFSVFVWNREKLEKIACELRKKEYICIAGGPEVTANPSSFKDFDYLVTGPGEGKVPEIIIQCTNTSQNKLPSLQKNTKDYANYSCYLDGTLDPLKYGGVLWELARGCPFKCSYCYESKGEKKIQRFSIERIRAELELFAKKNVPQVFVLDPTYNANKQQALELLKLIAKKTPNTFYYFEARGEFIDRELAKAFTTIPCALQIGLQSSNEEVLQLVNRPFNRKQFLKGINCLNNAGVIFGFDLIYGLPGDTLKSFKQSVDFALSLFPNNLEIFRLSVLPGTDLADKAQNFNLTYQKNPPYHVIHTDKFSEVDLQKAEKIAHACSVFYNDGRSVPWFNTIARTLHMRPVQLLENFAEWEEKLPQAKKNQASSEQECNHLIIEKLQLDFLNILLKQKNQEKYVKLISDIIRLNGAISRTQDTGKSEKITLNYPAEYVDSQYATDLSFFLQNVRPKQNSISTFKKNGQTYWK